MGLHSDASLKILANDTSDDGLFWEQLYEPHRDATVSSFSEATEQLMASARQRGRKFDRRDRA